MAWYGAQAVFGVHVALLFFLGGSAAAAATGALRRYPRWSGIYWLLFAATASAQLLPACPLTDIERFLRYQSDPGWGRSHSVLNTVQHFITRAWLPEWAFTIILVVLVLVSVYAWARYHRHGIESLTSILRDRHPDAATTSPGLTARLKRTSARARHSRSRIAAADTAGPATAA